MTNQFLTHALCWAVLIAALALMGYAQAASSVAHVVYGGLAQVTRQWPWRTVLYRVVLVICYLAVANAAWRVSHFWWAALISLPVSLIIAPRFLARKAVKALGTDEHAPAEHLKWRWVYVVLAYVLLQLVDVVGSFDYTPFN